MKTRKVIHVELKEPGDRPKHFYFGSKKAVYDVLSNEEVNPYKTLLNCVKLSKEPYENKKCIIRQGILIPASMNIKSRGGK
ncbi:MAG: hypothetical protein II670_14610 [Alphaproteobacteria bacterium]|nr:hypothetical protein [Alphaproteobacteria bacterium]